MKNVIRIFWVVLAFTIILAFPMSYILENTNFSYPMSIVFSLIPSFLLVILLRKKLKDISILLLKFFLCIFSSLIFFFSVYIILSEFKPSKITNLILILFPLIFFLFSFISSIFKYKNLFKFLIFSIIFLLLVIFIYPLRQKYLINKFEKNWISSGYSLNINEIFPHKSSKEQCFAWISKLEEIFPKKKNTEFQDFYNEVVSYFNNGEHLKILSKGIDARNKILENPMIKDPRWVTLNQKSIEIIEEMKNCPYLQWFEPEKFSKNLKDQDNLNLLPIVRWARCLLSSSQIAFATEKREEGELFLSSIYEIGKKFIIKGQNLINYIIEKAIMRFYTVGSAFKMQITKEELKNKKEIEEIANGRFEIFFSVLKGELYLNYLKLKNLKGEGGFCSIYGCAPGNKTPKFLLRALNLIYTKALLSELQEIKKFEEDKKYFKEILMRKKEKTYFFYLKSVVARDMVLIAQARALILSNEILKYFKEYKKLPENLDFINSKYKIDPFSEKEFFYKKLNENKFIVYSIGPNLKDDGGKNLYIFNVIDLKENSDEDVGFCFYF